MKSELEEYKQRVREGIEIWIDKICRGEQFLLAQGYAISISKKEIDELKKELGL